MMQRQSPDAARDMANTSMRKLSFLVKPLAWRSQDEGQNVAQIRSRKLFGYAYFDFAGFLDEPSPTIRWFYCINRDFLLKSDTSPQHTLEQISLHHLCTERW